MIHTLQQGQFGRTVIGATGGGGGGGYRLRLQFGGADGSTTFTDDSGKTVTPGGNAQIDTSLGDQRGLFDGNDYLQIADHADLRLPSGVFEFAWVCRQSDKTGFQTFFSKGYTGGSPAGNGYVLQSGNGDGKLNLYTHTGSLILAETTGTVNNGQDYDMRFGRDSGGNLYFMRDSVTTGSVANATAFNTTGTMYIGGGSNVSATAFGVKGWFKDFRLQW